MAAVTTAMDPVILVRELRSALAREKALRREVRAAAALIARAQTLPKAERIGLSAESTLAYMAALNFAGNIVSEIVENASQWDLAS